MEWQQQEWFVLWQEMAYNKDYLGKPDNLKPLMYDDIKTEYGEEEKKEEDQDS